MGSAKRGTKGRGWERVALMTDLGAQGTGDGFECGAADSSRPATLLRRWKFELEGHRSAVAALRRAGFTRTSNARMRALLLSLAVVIFFVVALLKGAPETVVGGTVALGAVLVGAQQFAASRNEVSLEKFYDRLQVTNDRLEEFASTREFIGLPFGRPEDGRFDDDDFHRRMYVFRELDNLEYAIAKYRIGFMSRDNAHRSLRTFRSRCAVSEAFCHMAHDQVHGTRSERDSGYDPQTKIVVCRILRQLGYIPCGAAARQSTGCQEPSVNPSSDLATGTSVGAAVDRGQQDSLSVMSDVLSPCATRRAAPRSGSQPRSRRW
jgi:hypothetical protein